MVKNIMPKQARAASNPIEQDISSLFEAAQQWASSKVEYVESDIVPGQLDRRDDELTELELSILRAIDAIKTMMNTQQARKAVGLKPKGRGKDKSYDPRTTSITDPQVEVIFRLMRKEIDREEAGTLISELISPNLAIDERTLDKYIDGMIELWFWFSSNDPNPLRIPLE